MSNACLGVKLTWALSRSVSRVAVNAEAVGVDGGIRDDTLKIRTCASNVRGGIESGKAATAVVGCTARAAVAISAHRLLTGGIRSAYSTCIHRLHCKTARHADPPLPRSRDILHQTSMHEPLLLSPCSTSMHERQYAVSHTVAPVIMSPPPKTQASPQRSWKPTVEPQQMGTAAHHPTVQISSPNTSTGC